MIRQAAKDFWKCAGLIGNSDQIDHERRECASFVERRGNIISTTQIFDDFGRNLLQSRVMGFATRNLKGLQDSHAGIEHRRQRTAKRRQGLHR